MARHSCRYGVRVAGMTLQLIIIGYIALAAYVFIYLFRSKKDYD